MTDHIQTTVRNHLGLITLARPEALNSLSLAMVRDITQVLLAWRDEADIRAVLIRGAGDRAFCAGGDIRFFYDAGMSGLKGGSALLEDFFTEEYALNHLIHFYPKPYIALMDGVVMGGGMGVAQAGPEARMRVVTERTKMAMPEVNIGLFPDVGGGHFLSNMAGELGTWLGVTGEIINAADAIYGDLADVFIPSAQLPALVDHLAATNATDIRAEVRAFAAPFRADAGRLPDRLSENRAAIDRHFAHDSVPAIMASLAGAGSFFAGATLAVMAKRSPLMMCVTLEQLRRSAGMGVANCLRLERAMVRRCFEHGEVLEGVRALVVDRNAPRWNPAALDAVTHEMVAGFFAPVWPAHAHPLRDLR
jgi:enoyl-CoA hydratase/carnithine racemase